MMTIIITMENMRFKQPYTPIEIFHDEFRENWKAKIPWNG